MAAEASHSNPNPSPGSPRAVIIMQQSAIRAEEAVKIPFIATQKIGEQKTGRFEDRFLSISSHRMTNAESLKREEEILLSSIFDPQKGGTVKTRGQLIERKIDNLESLAGKVSNRRSRRWLNDRLLIELVPRLDVDEIRGLFAPPPWGEDTPLSAFCMTNVGDWDPFRNIDMDAEAKIIEKLEKSSGRRKCHANNDKAAALNAWHRVDCRTREALRRNFLSDLVEGFEDRIREFIKDSNGGDVLVLHVQDPFHRLLLHGICEFYNLTSVTVSTLRGSKLWKMTEIKKKSASQEVPSNITLTHFLKMAKDGVL